MDTDASIENDPHVVDSDLPCVGCGYNLRTIPWESKCPECGRPVLQSGAPIGFRFGSRRSEKRTSLGIALLAVALIVDVLGISTFTGASRLSFVIPAPLFSAALYIWAYAGRLSNLVRFGAILLITQPFARGDDHFRPRLMRVTVALATVGIAGVLVDLAMRFSSGSSGLRAFEWVIVEHVADQCYTVAYVLTLVHLFSRIDRSAQPFLWWLTRIAVAASILLLLGHIAWIAPFYLEAAYTTSLPQAERSAAWQQVTAFLLWWSGKIAPLCQATVLTACLWLLRGVQTCPRRRAG